MLTSTKNQRVVSSSQNTPIPIEATEQEAAKLRLLELSDNGCWSWMSRPGERLRRTCQNWLSRLMLDADSGGTGVRR